ncbi:MAG TPA: hypothetical protein VN721_06095 [Flavipsychrobacter sp.]|nr:hypothetical protein [Flavipsychrobacter sp.]
MVKGKVIDTVACKNQYAQSFALYLPSYYSINKNFPCIYFFDAHARGSLPVRTYKDIAEKYGFILIGSNFSKNGIEWQVTNDAIKALMDDTRSRINIDTKRIYAAGFSGGARVASSIAILDHGIAGVIGCAAGFPKTGNEFQNKFDYFGIVGNYDFNLIEMESLNETLAQNGFTHQLLTANGIHDWALATDFQTALLWMQVNAMKENLQSKNDTLINIFKNDFDKRIGSAVTSKDWIAAHELLGGIVRTLDGLQDVSSYKKQLDEMTASPAYKDAVTLQAQLQQTEQNQQQELAEQFAAQDEQWWTKKIADMNHNIQTAASQQESQMDKRLLNFLGLIGYMNSNHALEGGDLNNATKSLQVFKMADPKNPDCFYLTAIYYMKKGNEQQAISSLNEAASLGYSDVSQLTTEPAFSSLQNNADFKNVVDKVAKNYTGKS